MNLREEDSALQNEELKRKDKQKQNKQTISLTFFKSICIGIEKSELQTNCLMLSKHHSP